ncbi:unnamed protein product [Brachionus calyciflorus]|uniref:DNA-directed RNA polymerase III subunit RPC3 n=1 Tax=Brachionus calyciflorus TaxID=104777 RepID=A0A813WQH7_9BILA|nr:unnamed protein product [Brachionus calyciflorus]
MIWKNFLVLFSFLQITLPTSYALVCYECSNCGTNLANIPTITCNPGYTCGYTKIEYNGAQYSLASCVLPDLCLNTPASNLMILGKKKMTTTENYLALLVVKENYGDLARLICDHLILKKSYPLPLLSSDLNIDKKQLAQILSILSLHDIVEFKLNSKNLVEYKFCTKNTLNLLTIPRNIAKIEALYGNFAALLIENLSLHGSLQSSLLILKVLDYFSKLNSLNDSSKQSTLLNQIKESFINLVNLNFIERLADLDLEQDKKDNKIPKAKSEFNNKYEWPELKFNDQCVNKLLKDGDLAMRLQIEEDFGDKNIYWRINYKNFLQVYRDDVLVETMRNRIDKNAGDIINVILRLANSKIENDVANLVNQQSKPITSIDIQKFMRVDHKMDSITVEKYLSVISQDSVLDKIGDYSGGAYIIDFKKALHNICVSHIESVVRERYGSKSLRIFRVIMDKYQLEQKQIEDFSMIPSKDCKALVYGMLNDGMLCITELSKTTDHAPSRTYYLFHIDIYSICKKLLENAYKSMANLIIKREYLTSENKRLIEKNKKINSIIESLQTQGAEQAEIDEVKSMISPEEHNMLNSFNDHVQRLELAEAQLQESLTLFQLYFYYHTIPPVITTDRPCVFKKNTLTGPKWNFKDLQKIFDNFKFQFRIGRKGLFQFENECDYIEANLREFIEWSGDFSDYERESHWAYADYKHMIELPIDFNCIDWSSFGFKNRNAKDSTLWIGSKGAYTPCHYDTYGYNLVYQIHGVKRWILFSPLDSACMYPTRVPFEESTVYTQVNIKNPDLKKFKNFNKVKVYVVELSPGDVLYVPHNWWHYVESLSDSISINTWVEIEGVDDLARLKEILCKCLIQGVMESNFVNVDKWINSSESYTEQDENMVLIQNCLQKVKENKIEKYDEQAKMDYMKLLENNEFFSHYVESINFDDYLNKFTLKIEEDEKMEKDEDMNPLLKGLADSLSDSKIIDLIAQNNKIKQKMVRAAKKQIRKKENYQSVNSDSDNEHYADDFDPKNPFGGDEIEDFNSKQEKILIDKMSRKGKKSFNYSSDEDEVLAFDDDDDSDDDKYDEDKYELEEEEDDGGDEENEAQNDDEDNLISTSWGRKKSAYYSGNKIQNEEDAELEEEEARLLQSKMMRQLDTNDFGLDAFKLKGDKILKTSEEIESKKLAEKALGEDEEQDEIDQDMKTISKNLSKLSKKEKLDFLKQESPELFELVRDFKQKMNELNQKLLPIYKAIKSGLIPTSLACDYIINKTKLYLMYASHLSFYFALKSQRLPVDNHPIVKNILQFRNLCKQINSIDANLNEEINLLVRAIQNGNQIVKKLDGNKKAKKSVKFETREERNKLVFDDDNKLESESDEIKKGENELDQEELNADKRAINYEMMKNKGLTPKRDKMYRNPRVRNRIKSRKALIKHKSIVPKVRSQDKRYGGEATGIRTNIVRAVKIK